MEAGLLLAEEVSSEERLLSLAPEIGISAIRAAEHVQTGRFTDNFELEGFTEEDIRFLRDNPDGIDDAEIPAEAIDQFKAALPDEDYDRDELTGTTPAHYYREALNHRILTPQEVVVLHRRYLNNGDLKAKEAIIF